MSDAAADFALRMSQRLKAREVIKPWLDALREQNLSAGLFCIEVPTSDQGIFLVGHFDEELREQGFTIVSHSHALIAQQDAPGGGKIYMQHLSLMIRSNTGAPKKIIL